MLRRTAHVFVRTKTNTNFTSSSQHFDSFIGIRDGKGWIHTGCRVLHVKEDSTRLCQGEDRDELHESILTTLRFCHEH